MLASLSLPVLRCQLWGTDVIADRFNILVVETPLQLLTSGYRARLILMIIPAFSHVRSFVGYGSYRLPYDSSPETHYLTLDNVQLHQPFLPSLERNRGPTRVWPHPLLLRS